MTMSRTAKFIATFVILVGVAYGVGKLSNSTVAIPPDFKEARTQGAIISQSIVNTSNSLTDDLNRISELERERKISEAVDLTTTLFERSEEVKRQAHDLSDQLEKMTGALSDIPDPEARALALESITGRLALISRLISYSDYLGQLLTNLRNRLSGETAVGNIQEMINQINAEVIAINNFNRQAADAMDEFDKLVK